MGMGMGFCCCGDNSNPSSSSGPPSLTTTFRCTVALASIPKLRWNDGRHPIWRQFAYGTVPGYDAGFGGNPFGAGPHYLEGTGTSAGQIFSKNRSGVFMSIRTGSGTYVGTDAAWGIDTYDCPLVEVYAKSGSYIWHTYYNPTTGDVSTYSDHNVTTSDGGYCSSGSMPSFSRMENWWCAEVATAPTTASMTVTRGNANLKTQAGTGPCCEATSPLYSGTQTRSITLNTINDGLAFGFSTVGGGNLNMSQDNSSFTIPVGGTSPACKQLLSSTIFPGVGSACFGIGNTGIATMNFYDNKNSPSGISEANGVISFSGSAPGQGLWPPGGAGNGCNDHKGYDGTNNFAPIIGATNASTYASSGTNTCAGTPWRIVNGYPGFSCDTSGSTS